MRPHSFLLSSAVLLASATASGDAHRRHHSEHGGLVSRRSDANRSLWKRTMGPSWSSKPTLQTSSVKTGVAAMQLTVVGTNHVLIIDKAENNPLQVTGANSAAGKQHPSWMQYLNYETGESQALDSTTNSFCAGGSWLSNGTMVSVGGNPRVNAASYYDQGGLTSVRIFKQCDDNNCEIWENANTVRMASARWYPGTARLSDGSLIITGGMTQGGFNNAPSTDNVFAICLTTTKNSRAANFRVLPNQLFPVTWLLPSGQLFLAANERAMLYDWQKNKETQLPNIPNGVRITYPFTAASALLPLTIANKWVPEVLFCGGSTIDDTIKAYNMSSQTPASKQCVRMALSPAGIKKGWIREQDMPTTRVMGEAILTPDGQVVIVNGAETGIAGYSNVHNPVGQSNADSPTYSGLVYNPAAKAGNRLSANMPASTIPRMYHSVATLTCQSDPLMMLDTEMAASGAILIAGSNPNADVSTAVYKTEYAVEMLNPPYMTAQRPSFTWCPPNVQYGKSFKLIINVPAGTKASDISVVLMDFGYHTHGVAVDQRLVELTWKNWDTTTNQILVKSPANGNYFAPGYGWLFVVVKGVPSVGQKTMVGTGADPPFDAKANANMLKKTKNTHGKAIW